jgi:hypothetical protein
MKKFLLLALFLALTPAARTSAQDARLSEVTLYSPVKHGPSYGKALFNFQTGSMTEWCSRWDLRYGAFFVNEYHDWFEVPVTQTSRSVIKDLGAMSWADAFRVPVVEPFPKLKEGEQRQVVVNLDGKDGKPGAPPSRPWGRGAPATNDEGSLVGSTMAMGNFPGSPVEQPWLLPKRPAPPTPAAPRARQDGVPKIDPIFARAVVGHVYVIHVVDDGADYYALFRVESLERGDHCTISWKLIPPPGK